MAVTGAPCINEAGEISAAPPLEVIPESGGGVMLAITPGDDGEILGTVDGVVQWVDAGQATGEVSSISTVAPLSADQPNGDVTLQLNPGADGNLLATVGGAVQWVDPTAEGIATQQYVLDQVGPVQTEVTANTNSINALNTQVGTNTGDINNLGTEITNLGNEVAGKADAVAAQAPLHVEGIGNVYTLSLPPGTDGQVMTTFGGAAVWADFAVDPVAWGSITGTLTDQADLADALVAKADVSAVDALISTLTDAVNTKVDAGGGVVFTIWAPIGPSDPTPPGAVDGDVVLRRTS